MRASRMLSMFLAVLVVPVTALLLSACAQGPKAEDGTALRHVHATSVGIAALRPAVQLGACISTRPRFGILTRALAGALIRRS